MTCREFVDLLMAYLEGDLAADMRAHFEEHLANCPDCLAYKNSYEQTIQLGKAVGSTDDDVPGGEDSGERKNGFI